MTWTDPAWKCEKCGTWVKPGEYHACGTKRLYQEVAGPDIARIAAALERIAKALESQVPQTYQPGACEFCGSIAQHLPGCQHASQAEIARALGELK